MRILTLVIVLLLTCYVNALAQSNYCLTGDQVKKVNFLLDNLQFYEAMHYSDSATLANRAKEITTIESLLAQAKRESANKDTLITIANQHSDKLEQALNKEQKKVKRRERLLWIAGAVGIAELGIALGIGLSSR